MKRLSTEDMAKMADVALNENISNDENADLVKDLPDNKMY